MSKVQLKYVGNFVELGYVGAGIPSLVENRGKRVPNNKDQVVEYLGSAATLIVSPGRREDFFDPTRSAGSASVATDGTYVWPKVLAYYVLHYDVLLPEDFETHMAQSLWRPPTTIDRLGLELPR